MRVLVVSPQPFFTPRGTPFSVYYRTLITAELGAQIDLLTYGEGLDVEIDGVDIRRIPHFRFLEPVPVGPSLAKVWLDFVLFLWTVVLLLRRRYDFVHAHEEAIFFLRYLKPIFRFKLVYDMHSSLPQQLVNFGFTRSRMLLRVFEFLERASVKHSDAIITISPTMARHAASLARDRERVFLIENSLCDEVRVVEDGQGSELDHRFDPLPEHNPIVAYAGTFEDYQGIDLLLRAHARVLSERPDAHLLLMGGTRRQVETYASLAEALGIRERCRFTGSLPSRLAREYLQNVAVAVSPRMRGHNTPMKIYELLSGGIPFVATRIVAHTQIVDDSVCLLVDPEPDAFAEGILTVLRNPAEAMQRAARSRAMYQAKYSRDAYASKMRDVLATVGVCAA